MPSNIIFPKSSQKQLALLHFKILYQLATFFLIMPTYNFSQYAITHSNLFKLLKITHVLVMFIAISFEVYIIMCVKMTTYVALSLMLYVLLPVTLVSFVIRAEVHSLVIQEFFQMIFEMDQVLTRSNMDVFWKIIELTVMLTILVTIILYETLSMSRISIKFVTVSFSIGFVLPLLSVTILTQLIGAFVDFLKSSFTYLNSLLVRNATVFSLSQYSVNTYVFLIKMLDLFTFLFGWQILLTICWIVLEILTAVHAKFMLVQNYAGTIGWYLEVSLYVVS